MSSVTLMRQRYYDQRQSIHRLPSACDTPVYDTQDPSVLSAPRNGTHPGFKSGINSNRCGNNWADGLADVWGNVMKECGKVAAAWEQAFEQCGGAGGRRNPSDGDDEDDADGKYEHVIAGGVKHRVKCGRAVTEDDWAALEARPRAGNKGKRVGFKVVGDDDVRFIPTIFELYKTEEHWKQCFFTKQDAREARQDISQGFAGIEWKIIHSEVQAETENRRKEILRQRNHPFRRFCRFLGFRG